MALVKLNDFEQLVASYIPFVSGALDFQREKQIQKALTSLYDQADALAVLLTQDIAAFLWWAAHIASAAQDAQGYADQIKAAIAVANRSNEAAWTEWLNVKYPADLRALYRLVTDDIAALEKRLGKAQAESLRKLEAEVRALEMWKRKVVTPALKEWREFHALWVKEYVPPLRTLKAWLAKPAVFADWAVNPLIVEMTTALAKPTVRKQVTVIEQILTDTWVNDPRPVWDAVQSWLVADM